MDLKDFFFDTGEIRLHGIEGPASGPPLVLLHGATSTCYEWGGVIPHLAERWHVYALDLRGHGQSGRPADLEGYHIRHNIADTLAFLRSVSGAGPAVLMGLSYGAVITSLTAQPAAGLLRAVVLEDPPLMLRRENEESKPFLDYFTWLYQMRQTANTVDEILPILSAQQPGVPPEALRGWAQGLAWLDPNFPFAITTGNTRETVRGVDFAAHFAGIACPALLLQADAARGAALAQVDADFFLQHAPHARMVRFPGSGHGIHIDQPAEFLQAFDEFTVGL